MNYRILQGDALAMLRTLPDESVHCGVTSPPYFGLRDYGTAEWDGGDPDCDHKPGNESRVGRTGLQGGTKTAGHKAEGYGLTCGKCGAVRVDNQIGLEPTPEEFIARLVDVFREFRRVLRSDGTLWINIGDSYASEPKSAKERAGERSGGTLNGRNGYADNVAVSQRRTPVIQSIPAKNLFGIPWMLAFALRADGWYLRSEIIWAKKSPMPESVTDRCTKAHEQVFMLTKSPRYFFDAQAIAEPSIYPDDNRKERSNVDQKRMPTAEINGVRPGSATYATRNKRSVWSLGPEPTPYAHFATMPTALVEPCILAGTSARGVCPACGAPWVRVTERTTTFQGGSGRSGRTAEDANANGKWAGVQYGENIKLGPVTSTTTTGWAPTCTCADARAEAEQLLADAGVRADFPDLAPIPATVLDPFAGSGTTLRVAVNLGRRAIGIELNPEYVALAERLLGQTQPALMGV